MMGSRDDHMGLAQRAAAVLYSRGAKRVWLFGALASGHTPDARSDLDLAVEGLSASRLRPAAAELSNILGFKVDLVDWDTAPPRLRPHVLRTRILLPRQIGDDRLIRAQYERGMI
jgi:predicted nucleotidyltransferase